MEKNKLISFIEDLRKRLIIITATVFVFGLGTTVGLIPLGLIMGSVTGIISKTKYERFVPKISGLLMMCFGLFLILAPIFGFEL